MYLWCGFLSIGQGGNQGGKRLACHGVGPVRGYFLQGQQDEGTLVQARVRHDQLWPVQDFVMVGNQVKIQHARCIADSFDPPEVIFDALKCL